MSNRKPTEGEIIAPNPLPDNNPITPLAREGIDIQIATAKQYPRVFSKIVDRIISLSTIDETAAKSMVYALPRKNKPIKGPSIRFAEIVFGQWGNCRVSSGVVDIDRVNKIIRAEGIFHDLETNAAWRTVVERRIVDSMGRIYNDDMIAVTGNAAKSIAARNAIFAGIPRAIWEPAYLRCERVIAGTVQSLAEARTGVLKEFAAFGITPERLCHAIEVRGIDDMMKEHIILCRQMHSALVNEDVSVEEMFPLAAAKQPDKKPDTQPATAAPAEAEKPADTAASTEAQPATQPDKEPVKRARPGPPPV